MRAVRRLESAAILDSPSGRGLLPPREAGRSLVLLVESAHQGGRGPIRPDRMRSGCSEATEDPWSGLCGRSDKGRFARCEKMNRRNPAGRTATAGATSCGAPARRPPRRS